MCQSHRTHTLDVEMPSFILFLRLVLSHPEENKILTAIANVSQECTLTKGGLTFLCSLNCVSLVE